MKKLFGILAVVLCFTLTTGCGKDSGKTIECSGTADGETTKFVATLDNDNKVVKIKSEIIMTRDEEISDEEFNMMKSVYASMFSSETTGVTFDIKRDGKKFIVATDFDFNKMSAADIENYFEAESLTADTFKEFAEGEDCTCK